MPQSKIALCMLVKNGRDLFEECLRNISKVVDEIVVVVDGESEDKCDDVAKSFGAKVFYRDLNGDFASQRNFGFDQVSDDIDWLLWLDSDDRVSEESAARIRTLADNALNENTDGFLFEYQYAFDATNRPTTVLKRERLLRKSIGWKWKYEIHEVCMAPEGVVPNMTFDPSVVIMHRKHEMPKEFVKPRRNLDIVEKVIHKYEDDVRMLFYTGNEYLAAGDLPKAKKYYRKVLKLKNTWSEQRFLAALRLGYMSLDEKDFEQAENWAWEAIKIDHRWAESFCLLGDIFMEKQEWKKAAHFYGFAQNTPVPMDLLMTYNPASYSWYPAGRRAAALQNVMEFNEALKSIEEAIKSQPRDKNLRVIRNHIVQQISAHRRDGLSGVLIITGVEESPSIPKLRMLSLSKGLEYIGVEGIEVSPTLDGKNHVGKMCVVIPGEYLPPKDVIEAIQKGKTDVIADFSGPEELLKSEQYLDTLKSTNLCTTNSPRLIERLRGIMPGRVKYIPDPYMKEKMIYSSRHDRVNVLVVSPDKNATGAKILPLLQGYENVEVIFLSPSEFSSEEWSEENLSRYAEEWADIAVLYDDRDDEAAGAGFLSSLMIAGLPVIAAAVPATVNIVDHGKSGLLCYAVHEWKTYIDILVKNERNERQRMGLNARLRARRFSPKSFADTWCDFTGIHADSIDVIIPCHGKNEMTKSCLANLKLGSMASTRPILVANPQAAELADELKGIVSLYPGAILEEQDVPKSFAANCNAGVAASTAEYISLLNNDTLVTRGWDEALLKTVKENDNRGIVSALSNGDFGWHYDEPLILDSQPLRARYEPSDFGAFYPLEQKVLEVGEEFREKYGSKGAQQVEWVSFAGVLMPKAVFEEIGEIDDKYENGMEDFDFCMRFKKVGGKCFYDWNSFIFHYCGQTRDEVYGTEDKSDIRKLMQLKNDIIYSEKKQRNEMSVRFFIGPPLENWLPEDIKEKGLGGSETCVAMTARELALLGWDVHVYSTDFEVATMRQGVVYRPWNQFDPWEKTDVLIVSRIPPVFDEPVLNAKLKILYNHDATYGDQTAKSYPSAERVKNMDYLFVLSQWHKKQFMELYPHIPEEKFVVTRNGVDMSRFERQRRGRIPKDAKRFVYSHSANRGLEELLFMWPHLMRMDPDFRLHVYYGFDTWIKMAERSGDTQSMERIKSIVDACNQPGVMLHSRVGQGQLAEEIGMANLALYPSHFGETSCITAMEYALGNTQMITTPIGALPETAFSAKFLKSTYMTPEFIEEFLQTIRDSINEPSVADRKDASQKTREIYDWKNVVAEWDTFFMEKLNPTKKDETPVYEADADIAVVMPYGGSGGVLYPQDLVQEWRKMGYKVVPWLVKFWRGKENNVDNVMRSDAIIVDPEEFVQRKEEVLSAKTLLAVNWQAVDIISRILQGSEKTPLLYNLIQGDETKWTNPEIISSQLSDDRWKIVYASDYLSNRFTVPGDIVPDGIDIETFNPWACENSGMKKDPLAVGFIDHASAMKNTSVLRAVAVDMCSPDWNPGLQTSVSIIMASPELNEDAHVLESLSSEGKNVIAAYEGPITKDEVAHIMSMCGVWLIPSLEEGFGLVPLEAMACGAIPIVSNVGGMRMYCKDGENCLVVSDPTDAKEWLDKISKVLNMDSEQKAKIRQAGIDTAAEFSISKSAGDFAKIFRRDQPKPERSVTFGSGY